MPDANSLLYATVVRMIAQHSGRIAATHGHQAHGAFLDIIRANAPELAAKLHNNSLPYKPFTVSPLQGLEPAQDGYAQVGAGQELWLRFSLLDAALFAPLAAHFLKGGARSTLRIGGVRFEITEVLSSPGAHPRAGYAVMGDLLARWRAHPDPLPKEVTLHFLSPTAIRVGKWPNGNKRFLLWPDPERVWYGLRRFWGKYGGDDPGKPYNEWVEKHVSVSEYRLQTRMLQYPKHAQVGFVGHATFRAESRDREAMALWHALADFAFYAGVGNQKTMGMGQTACERQR